MLRYFVWILVAFSILSNFAFAGELMKLLSEGALIENEAPYGYSFNSLSYREGHLTQTPMQDIYQYFDDPLCTDADRYKFVAKKQEHNLDFAGCYDSKRKYWEGFCDRGAEASICPDLHKIITSTQGPCPSGNSPKIRMLSHKSSQPSIRTN